MTSAMILAGSYFNQSVVSIGLRDWSVPNLWLTCPPNTFNRWHFSLECWSVGFRWMKQIIGQQATEELRSSITTDFIREMNKKCSHQPHNKLKTNDIFTGKYPDICFIMRPITFDWIRLGPQNTEYRTVYFDSQFIQSGCFLCFSPLAEL